MRTVDRQGSDSLKWAKYAGKDIIPLWIADTDYRVDEAVIDALHERVNHGVLGYGFNTESFRQAIVAHCMDRYHWEIEAEWICPVPGVVPGINLIRAMAIKHHKPHGVTMSPTYPHLRNHAQVLDFSQSFAEMLDDGEGWKVDFSALEKLVTPQTGLLLLCHPHNPIGKTYSQAELQQFAAFAEAHDLMVCSDEIHCDLTLFGNRHYPFAMTSDDAAMRTITLMAASKTFNIAGLTCAFAIIPNAELRAQFMDLMCGTTGDVNVLGMAGTIAAFQAGAAWHQNMIKQFEEHAELVFERINAMPFLRMKKNQATFLAWIDATDLPVAHPQYFFEKAGVGLADGIDYGWHGFLRLNFGCSTEMLLKALDRMDKAIAALL